MSRFNRSGLTIEEMAMLPRKSAVHACEMCPAKFAYWHQLKPVERWLCTDCAEKDQRSSQNWHGEFDNMRSR